MTAYRGIAVTTLAALCVALCAGPASAVFDKDEAKCRKELSKDLGKMVKLINKAFAKCHKDQQNDKIPDGVDCNDLSEPLVDPKSKVAKIEGKALAGIAKKCGSLDGDVLARYISCPVDPCTGVASNPMQSYAELAACMVCVAESTTSTRSAALLGSANPAPSGVDAKCNQAVAKGYGKLVDKIIKDRTKCQGLADKFATTDIDNDVDLHCEVSGRSCSTNADCQQFLAGSECAGCVSSDAKGKVAKAKAKAETLFDKACTGDTTGVFPCGDPDPAVAKACLATAAEGHGDQMVLASYEMDATICPVGLQSLIFAGNGVGEDLSTFVSSRTSLEVGWTGLGHPQDLPDRYAIDLDATCPSSTTPCGTCTIDGVDTTSPSAAYRMRCRDDKTIPCTLPFQVDPACPGTGGSFCSYFLSAPAPLSAANNPVCIYNRLDGDVTGTATVETGIGELSIPTLRTVVAFGESQTRPCPICAGKCVEPAGGPTDGDPCETDNECDSFVGAGNGVCDLTTEKPNDNLKQGVCKGGIDDGLPCDVQSFDRTFSPVVGTGTSLDCRQAQAADISTLRLAVDLTTGSVSLPFGTTCEGGFSGFSCACALCSNDKSFACNSDAECAAIDLGPCSGSICAGSPLLSCSSNADCNGGTCTENTNAGAPRQPNNCLDDGFICSDTGDGINGICPSTVDSFCDGVLRGNGEGFLTCGTNSDCDTIASQCGGDCGKCTTASGQPAAGAQRRCFLDPIVATGVPDTTDPLLVATFCVPPTVADSVNLASGTPGPVRVRVDSRVTKKY